MFQLHVYKQQPDLVVVRRIYPPELSLYALPQTGTDHRCQIVACGFIIRLEAGAAAGEIELSHWLIIMTFILSLFLAFAKRRDDLLNFMETGQISRKNITGYTIDYLNVILSFLSSIIAVTYILYTLSPEVTSRSSEYLYATVPFVLAGIMRYLQIILVEKSNCNPTDILLQDRTLQLTVAGWFIVFALLIY